MLYKAKPTTETDSSYMIGPHLAGLIIRHAGRSPPQPMITEGNYDPDKLFMLSVFPDIKKVSLF